MGEDPELAVVREFAEETGLIVTPLAHLTRADQYFLNTNGETHNNRGHFFSVRIKDEDAALKVENDHTLTWLSPDRALRLLRHEAHAWAVAFYLRRGTARGAGRV